MLNRAMVQGRLVADPELRQTSNGVAVCSFRVAWSETYKERETKLFLSCDAWRGIGEMVAKYFHKGKEIVVEGSLHTETWQDNNGGNRSVVKMTVDRVHFCGSKSDADGGANNFAPAGSGVNVDANGFEELDDDDGELPF